MAGRVAGPTSSRLAAGVDGRRAARIESAATSMRDIVAAVLAVALALFAASLATTLRAYRLRRQKARDSERALGRTIIAELPTADDLVLVSEDAQRFYYGERSIDKDLIVAVRVLVNGTPIATQVSQRRASQQPLHPTSFEDRPEGIARDRWDVAIETVAGTTLVECGSVRERVSQELARTVFDAVKRDVERRDQTPGGGQPGA
jgi:hypothetical protein